jgi:primosomal protein N' (replication factor Y)
MTNPMYVEVAVNLPPVQGTFDYHVPTHLRDRISLGHLVTAPFGNRRVQGVVVGMPKTPAVPNTRPIEDLIDPDPVLTIAQLDLAKWLASAYHAPLIDCITLMIPPGLSQQADSHYHLLDPEADGETPTQTKILSLLKRRGDLRGRQIAHSLPRLRWRPAADTLLRKGFLERHSVLDPPRVRPRRVRSARLALPPGTAIANLDDIGRKGGQAAERRRRILEALIEEGEPLEVGWLYAEYGAKRTDLVVLEECGLISLSEAEIWRDPLDGLEFVASDPPTLTQDQLQAWKDIGQTIHRSASGERARPILLHGVTGSGKTELYLRAVAETLAQGRSAIVLVPEIALTPQTVRRFLSRFPGRVGLSHSQLSQGERFDTWRRCRAGLLDVMVGPRSALFTPFPNIGLIVLDESHDDSYKEQERSPRYHTLRTAVAYAEILGAVSMFGTATPSVVTRYRAEQGRYHLVKLPQRILGHREHIAQQAERLGITDRYQDATGDARYIDLPPVRVVDMRQELKSGNRSIFSRALQKSLDETLQAGHQAILFLNRRGSATYIFCRDCGWVARCPRCDTPLTHHTNSSQLTCHHCGYAVKSKKLCPSCGGSRVKEFGAGTERVQQEVEQFFPQARTIRWDWDSTRARGSHEVILAHFAAHRANVLIGTQMLAKGLDLPLVTLVGVVSADTGLYLPDFRSAERTFQVLTQVAGRAGRGLLGGRVILQTYQPDHYAIQAASKHDHDTFYRQELRHREELRYPPFTRLVRLVYRDTSDTRAEEEAVRLHGALEVKIQAMDQKIDLIGPTSCFFKRIRGQYRWQIILRGSDPASAIPDEFPDGWSINVDPINLL